MMDFLVSADWAKDLAKRVCCCADIQARRVSFPQVSVTFDSLLELARTYALRGPTLLSLDLAMGVPKEFLKLAEVASSSHPIGGFLPWLANQKRSSQFWTEVHSSHEWSVARPFLSVPPGTGSLRAFQKKAGHDLRREIDRCFQGKSPFIVSGIPGSVGSGTRSFWRELVPHLAHARDFGIWPFEGSLEALFARHALVLGESYPAISYTAVFADRLPSCRYRLSKTVQAVRAMAIEQVSKLPWLLQHRIELPDLEICIASEDHFDALMLTLGPLRMLLEGVSLVDQEMTDEIAEGGILGSNAIDRSKKSILFDRRLGYGSSPAKGG